MSDFILITGGARSGKSSFAELLAKHFKLPVTYIATAQVWDDEMAARVKKHKEDRPPEWDLIEEPFNIKKAILNLKEKEGVILLDCVTLWLSNLLLTNVAEESSSDNSNFENVVTEKQTNIIKETEKKILEQVREVGKTIKEIKPTVIFVTNEVGLGIVPDNPLARAYRDLAGRSNQILAEFADKVYFVVAGYPLEIKQSGQELINSLSFSR